jgi:hypothetical protein
MKKKPSVDELQSLFSTHEEKMKLIIEREIEKGIDKALKKITSERESPPMLGTLEELTKGNSPVLRRWTGGKYKCASLEVFIISYTKITDNLTPALIRDYILCEKTGKPYSDNSIETCMKHYGPGRKSSK